MIIEFAIFGGGDLCAVSEIQKGKTLKLFSQVKVLSKIAYKIYAIQSQTKTTLSLHEITFIFSFLLPDQDRRFPGLYKYISQLFPNGKLRRNLRVKGYNCHVQGRKAVLTT